MSTKYYCDVCKEEFQQNQLTEVRVDYRDDETVLYFDVCKQCREKMFKGVKEFHTTLILSVSSRASLEDNMGSIIKTFLFFRNQGDARKRFPRAKLVQAFVGIEGWMWTTKGSAKRYEMGFVEDK